MRAMVQRNEDGEPQRSVGFIIDITDQKTAALEIESNKEKLELALQASQAGYFEFHWKNKTVEWSSRMYDILGFNRSFVPDLYTFNSLVHPDDLASFETMMQTMRVENAPVDTEVRLRQGEGKFIWIQLRANLYTDAQGQPERTIGFILDISEQKRIERELEESKELFEDVATAAGEYIWEFDRRGVFTFVSERVEAVLGYPPQEVIGRSPLDYMGEEARNIRSRFVRLMAQKEGFKGLEIPGYRKDGSIVW